jgi:TatD DNase family protein
MLIDSHTHIYLPEFEEDFSEMVARARAVGVRYFLMPNVDVETIPLMHRIQDRLPDHAFPMMGLHPCSVKDDFENQLEEIKRHLFQPVRKYLAVGEIGIDLYWDKSTLDIQIKAFEMQIEWAKALNLPIVIHVRDAFDEVFEVLDRVNDDRLRGVFHCFTGTKEQAQHIIDYGSFKLGIGGVVTFKNGKIDQFISEVDMSHLILETDAPYLAPVPHRGKRNEPAYSSLVANKLAECYGVSGDEIALTTTQNCIDLFKLNLTNHEEDPAAYPDFMDD